MAEMERTRRVCVLADIDGYGEQQPVAQSGLMVRLKGVVGAALKSAGVDVSETWRQDRGSRQLALLPVAADVAAVVPLLARALVAELEKDRAGSSGPLLRVRLAVTRDTVTQVKGSYAGRAVVTATRLLDSPAVRAELSGDSAAFALIISDGAYQDVLTRRQGKFPLDGFHRVSIDVPEQGWQGTGWVRACAPGSLEPPPKRIAGVIRDNVIPALAAAAGDTADVLATATGTAGSTGHDELATAASNLLADHAITSHAHVGDHVHPVGHGGVGHESYEASGHTAAETAYVVDETHTYTYDNNGYIQEYGTHTVYDGAAYDAHGYESSGEQHHGDVRVPHQDVHDVVLGSVDQAERHRRRVQHHQHATPVRVVAEERGLDERRRCDPPRDRTGLLVVDGA